ncbi:MAG: hypothetical protein ACOVLE_06830, partial [Pirellula staleyi]
MTAICVTQKSEKTMAKLPIPKLFNWTIRKKLLVSVVVLGIVVAVLGYSSFRGVYAYRDLANTLSSRASEMPLTTELTRAIDELRIGFRRLDINQPMEIKQFSLQFGLEARRSELRFQEQLQRVRLVLARYKWCLERSGMDDPFLSDRTDEFRKTSELSELLNIIAHRHG